MYSDPKLVIRLSKILFLILGLSVTGWGQEMMSDKVDTIYLRDKKAFNSSKSKSYNINQTQINQYSDLPSLLAGEENIYVRSYGGGSASTLSIRGGSSSQSLILWNEVPIVNPMLGLQDLRLIPLNIVSNVDISHAGNSTNWGSGAISGAINLYSKPQFKRAQNLSVGLNSGSFGLSQKLATALFSAEKTILDISWQDRSGNHNFPFTIGNEKRENANASFAQRNLIAELFHKISEKDQISLHYWKQDATAQIPPTTTQNLSLANQEDSSDKYLLKYNRVSNKYSFKSKLAYISDNQIFSDPLIFLFSNNRYNTLFAEINTKYYMSDRSSLELGLSSTRNEGSSDNYATQQVENRWAVYPAYSYSKGKLHTRISTRLEWIDNVRVPILPAINLSYDLAAVYIDFGLSRNYRAPSLNDRFWQPGGNSDLLPEQGWSQELSLNMNRKELAGLDIDLSLVFYNRQIENWILWSRKENSFFFSPSNLAEVWSRGIELGANLNYQLGDYFFNSKINYSYGKSTNQVALSSPEIEEGQQLLYTPEYLFSWNQKLRFCNFLLQLNNQYVGPTQGINEGLESYWLSDLYLSQNIEIEKGGRELSLFIRCNNITNQEYRVIERRPMPGRNYELGFTLNFNN